MEQNGVKPELHRVKPEQNGAKIEPNRAKTEFGWAVFHFIVNENSSIYT